MNTVRTLHRMSFRQIACTLATSTLISHSAYASTWPTNSADNTRPNTILEVQIDPDILHTDYLREWVDSEVRSFLTEQPDRVDQNEQLRITIDGTLYDYRVTFTAFRDRSYIREPHSWLCKCANEELLDQLLVELPKFMPIFDVVDRKASQQTESSTTQHNGGLGPLSIAGISSMALGGAGVITGVIFVSLGENSEPDPNQRELMKVRSFQLPGAVAIAGGGGLLITGAMLYLFRNAKLRRKLETMTVLSPSIDTEGNPSLFVRGRF